MSTPPFGIFGQKTRIKVDPITAEQARKLLKDNPEALLPDVRMGYENVYNLGGIMNWPYEVVRGR